MTSIPEPISRDLSEITYVHSLFLEKMPEVCVAAGCSNQKDEVKGISLHVIPFFEDDRPEAKRRRKKWVDFVKQKRAKWEPSKHSVICSVHFKPEDFERRFVLGEPGGKSMPRWLRKDEFGCCVFPTIHTVGKEESMGKASKREKRMVSHLLHNTFELFVF